jgi:hypothetical protein
VVIQRSLNKADHCRCLTDSQGKIKLEEEAISEILVADTHLETGAEVNDVEDYFEEALAEVKPQAAKSGGLPTWRPPHGRNTNIRPLVGPAKGVKKSEAPHINKHSLPLSVLMLCVRNLSSPGGTDQLILTVTLRQTSRT